MVGIAVAERRGAERLGQGVKALPRAEPGEMIAAMRYLGAELPRKRLAQGRIRAVRTDDEIRRIEFIDALDLALILGFDSDGARPALQDTKQIEPADGRKADAVDQDPFAAVDDRDVLPGLEKRRDRRIGLGIIVPQELQRPIREHHAESKRRTRRILLDDTDLSAGKAALQQITEIQARRARAENRDVH